MSNRIPRKFDCIIGKMLIDTNMDRVNDIIHVYKNDFGYLGLNTKTNKHAYYPVSMLRDAEVFELMKVEV